MLDGIISKASVIDRKSHNMIYFSGFFYLPV